MEELKHKRLLLTGATGFVGTRLYPALVNAGFDVVCGTREPLALRKRYPEREIVQLDMYDPESTLHAMHGCHAAIFLMHAMSDREDYESAEQHAAGVFTRAAEHAGLSRIVYLGGLQSAAAGSRHLRSRRETGEILRSGTVPTIELQATMIIGPGSASWRIVRDLAARLPLMVLPRWLDSRSQPIAIDDVTLAIVHALAIELPSSAVYALPGPEPLSAREIIVRTAGLMGLAPRMIRVPVLSPRLSSYWIKFVTRANGRVSRELVEGLRSDLLAPDRGFWRRLPEHTCLPFDEAARRALAAEDEGLSSRSRALEWLLHRLTPAAGKTERDHAAV